MCLLARRADDLLKRNIRRSRLSQEPAQELWAPRTRPLGPDGAQRFIQVSPLEKIRTQSSVMEEGEDLICISITGSLGKTTAGPYEEYLGISGSSFTAIEF
ncbi:hypothetical protein CB1_001219026 [Camelus ferus]|nr:hypothetical protein CB1_001219026 [Camelus ferus]